MSDTSEILEQVIAIINARGRPDDQVTQETVVVAVESLFSALAQAQRQRDIARAYADSLRQ